MEVNLVRQRIAEQAFDPFRNGIALRNVGGDKHAARIEARSEMIR